MPELFSGDWMTELKEQWNDEPGIKERLAEMGFDAIITCGFKNEDQPRGVCVIKNGECISAGEYDGETPDWDMRASRKDWMKWITKGIGMTGMGMAYTTGKLKFESGDYSELIKNPKMAASFVKSFSVMKNIDTQ